MPEMSSAPFPEDRLVSLDELASDERLRSHRRLRVLAALNYPLAPGALRYAARLCERFEAEIAALHVVVPVEAWARGLGAFAAHITGWKLQVASELHAFVRQHVPVRCHDRSIVSMGHPGVEIVANAERIGADLIVLTPLPLEAARRREGEGTTTDYVITHATVPVLVPGTGDPGEAVELNGRATGPVRYLAASARFD